MVYGLDLEGMWDNPSRVKWLLHVNDPEPSENQVNRNELGLDQQSAPRGLLLHAPLAKVNCF